MEQAAGCGSESTRTNSDAASSLTLCAHRINNGRYTTWTNEKHNSYLGALETSFVDQLQHSIVSKNKRLGTILSRSTRDNADYPCDQFAVLQGGSRRKKMFENSRLSSYGAAGTRVAMESSRLLHFLPLEKLSNSHSVDPTENIFGSDNLQLSEKRLYTHKLMSCECPSLCHLGNQDTVDTLTEGSDQNFIDEDRAEKTNSFSSVKRLKQVKASLEEQIVPCDERVLKENVVKFL